MRTAELCRNVPLSTGTNLSYYLILKIMSRFWSGKISLPLTKPCVHFHLLTIVCDALLVNCPNWPLIQMGTVMQLPTSQCDNIVWVEKPSSRLNPSHLLPVPTPLFSSRPTRTQQPFSRWNTSASFPPPSSPSPLLWSPCPVRYIVFYMYEYHVPAA